MIVSVDYSLHYTAAELLSCSLSTRQRVNGGRREYKKRTGATANRRVSTGQTSAVVVGNLPPINRNTSAVYFKDGEEDGIVQFSGICRLRRLSHCSSVR